MNKIIVTVCAAVFCYTSHAQLTSSPFSLEKMVTTSTSETPKIETFISSEGYTYYGIRVDTTRTKGDVIVYISTRYIYGLDIVNEAEEEAAIPYVNEETLYIWWKYQKHVKAKEWFVIEDRNNVADHKYDLRSYTIINRNKVSNQQLIKDILLKKGVAQDPYIHECMKQIDYGLPHNSKGNFYISIHEFICKPDLAHAYFEYRFYNIKPN